MRISLIIFLMITTFLSADYDAKSSYSVDELIRSTVKTHPNIKIYEQLLRGSTARVNGAMWSYFPTPRASAYRTDKGVEGLTLAVSQPIWTGGKLNAKHNSAVASEKASRFELRENAYILIETLIGTIESYLNAKGSVKALQDGLDELNDLRAMLERRIAAGVSSRADLELLKSRIYQAESDLSSAKSTMSSALSQMELLTSKHFSENIDIYSNKQKEMLSPVNYYVDRMEQTHPALRKLEAQVETAKADKSVAKAAIWPDVSVVVEKRTAGTDPFDTGYNSDTAVYLSVNASPGAGLSALSGIQEAEAKVMKLIYEKESKQRDLTDKIHFAYNDYTAALIRQKSQKSTIDASSNVLASYKRLFLAGKKQWLDLVNTSRELTNSKIAYAQLNSVLISSSYTLDLLAGNIDVMGGVLGDDYARPESPDMLQAKNKKEPENITINEINKIEKFYIQIGSKEDTQESDVAQRAEKAGYKSMAFHYDTYTRLLIGPYEDKAEMYDDLKVVRAEVDKNALPVKMKEKNTLEQKQ
ncbi:MAG: TolC family protein [Campylobacterales bacterium]|nr:TolC family protein [Campylobacterales bacterium]